MQMDTIKLRFLGAPEERMQMEEYKNEDKKCECWKCEKKDTCQYRDKYQRLPREVPGALGLCKKLEVGG